MKILVAAGASGGHIFPALSFMQALKENQALLVLPKKSIKDELAPGNFQIKYISISNIGLRPSLNNCISFFNFLKASFESFFLMLEFRPDVVVGFGSLACVPLVIFGWLFRIKTLIHEQNVVPGRANRFLAQLAEKTAISFEQSRKYLKVDPEKIILTGNPLRRELKIINRNEALKFFGFEESFTLLVMGGSQGSHRINEYFVQALSGLRDLSKFQIIHICGKNDYETLLKKYRQLNCKFRLFPFLKEMQYAYSASDLALSRAGATTITELIYFTLPAVIIPYPFAYAHQLENAKVLESGRTAVVIKDTELKVEGLRQVLLDLINDPEKLKRMREGFKAFPKNDAASLLAKEALS